MSQPVPDEPVAAPPVPRFEGHDVRSVAIKIAGLNTLTDPKFPVFRVDDAFRLVGEFRCTGVRHYVGKDGEMVREQVITPIAIDPCPWNPEDPLDDGVIRKNV